MTELDLLGAVAQVGFPIAVASWLLIKGAQQHERYIKLLERIAERLEHIEGSLNRREK